MAIPRPEAVSKSECWDEDELSEMMGLLQRAEQRMRNSDPASRHIQKATNPDSLCMLNSGTVAQLYITSTDGIARADRTRLIDEHDRQITARRVEDPVKVKEGTKKEKPTAGPCWFDMPRTDLSSELKSDLNLLHLRNVLDPHRHYRSDSTRRSAPGFTQLGQIIQGPTEYFSSRLSNKERKRTLVEEILATEQFTSHFKKKYKDIQASKTSGKKPFYKNLKARRSGGVRKA